MDQGYYSISERAKHKDDVILQFTYWRRYYDDPQSRIERTIIKWEKRRNLVSDLDRR